MNDCTMFHMFAPPVPLLTLIPSDSPSKLMSCQAAEDSILTSTMGLCQDKNALVRFHPFPVNHPRGFALLHSVALECWVMIARRSRL